MTFFKNIFNSVKKNRQFIFETIDIPRKNWENEFKKMNENGDDKLPINDVFEDENLPNHIFVHLF